MANIVATPHWAEIQRLAELGVPLQKLAEKYTLSIATVWSQATRNDWLLPRRLKAKAAQIEAENAQLQKRALLGGKSLSEFGERAFIESIEEKREYLTTLTFETAVEAMEDSKGKLIAEKPSEYKALVHVARQALGMDTDAPQVQLSLFAGADLCGPSVMESQAIECETFQPDEEDADFWG